MAWRNASLAACSCAILLAGCGGSKQTAPPPRPPRIPADVASRLAAEANAVANAPAGSCAAREAAERLRRDVIASIGRVPSRYQEPLTGTANDLAERLSSCTEPEPSPRKHGKKGRGEKKHGRDDR